MFPSRETELSTPKVTHEFIPHHLHVPTSFWVFYKMCGPSCAHVLFCEFLYAKGMLKQKHVNAFFVIFFYVATVEYMGP
jgi:hypothetical protein